jgi:hypothetical protein
MEFKFSSLIERVKEMLKDLRGEEYKKKENEE